MTDKITVLLCARGKRAAKAYYDPAEDPSEYDAGKYFEPVETEVSNLAELAEVLDDLRGEPGAFVVRGAPIERGAKKVRRVCQRQKDGTLAEFESAAHHWVMLDADKTEVPFNPRRPRASVEAWRKTLPAGLRDAEMLVHLSGSQHRKANVRAHAWIWCDQPMGDLELRAWARAYGLDPAIYNPVQPHYTADPVFLDCEDPLARRRKILHLPGKKARLRMPDGSAPPKDGGPSNASKSKAVEGLDKPLSKKYADARAALVRSLGDPRDWDGSRFTMCGAIGGMLCKSRWPAHEAAQVVREWLDVGDEGIDVELGVWRAVGAWELDDPNTATGFKELESICGRGVAKALDAVATGLEETREERLAKYEEEEGPPNPKDEGEDEEDAGPWAGIGESWTDANTLDADIPYVVPGLEIGPGKVSAITGAINTGKTPFGLELAVCVALGQPFYGHETVATKVAYVAFEGARLAKKRLKRICQGHGFELNDILGGLLVFITAPPGIFDTDKATELAEECQAQDVGLVILDTYNAGVKGGLDSNQPTFADPLKALGFHSDASGITFVALLHERKPGADATEGIHRIAGTTALGGALQSAISLTRPEGLSRQTIQVECAREVETPFEPFRVVWTDADDGGLCSERHEVTEVMPGEHPSDAPERDALKADILRVLADPRHAETGLARGQISTWLRVPHKGSALTPKLQQLMACNEIHVEMSLRGKSVFRIGPDTEANQYTASEGGREARQRIGFEDVDEDED
jgi:hypothetical protein